MEYGSAKSLELEEPLILSVVLGEKKPPKSSTSVCSPGNFQHMWRCLFCCRLRVKELLFKWLQDPLFPAEEPEPISPPQRMSAQLLCSDLPGEKGGRGQDLLDFGLNNSALVLVELPPVMRTPEMTISQESELLLTYQPTDPPTLS